MKFVSKFLLFKSQHQILSKIHNMKQLVECLEIQTCQFFLENNISVAMLLPNLTLPHRLVLWASMVCKQRLFYFIFFYHTSSLFSTPCTHESKIVHRQKKKNPFKILLTSINYVLHYLLGGKQLFWSLMSSTIPGS